MLCLRVDGIMEEICVTEITKISSDDVCTHVFMRDGREIYVDEKEENLRKAIQFELLRVNTSEPLIRLHQYFSSDRYGYYPICFPVSAINSVARGYYSYGIKLVGKLVEKIPEDAREKDVDRQQPTLIFLKYPVKDSKGDMVEKITVFESMEYVMRFIETVN